MSWLKRKRFPESFSSLKGSERLIESVSITENGAWNQFLLTSSKSRLPSMEEIMKALKVSVAELVK